MSVAGDGAPALGVAEDASRPRPADSMVMDGLSSSKVTGIDSRARGVSTKYEAHTSQSSTMTHQECFL